VIEKVHPAEDAVYLLAYPRSGSTWFRYCVEFITKRRTNNSAEEMMTWETNAGLPRLLYSTHDYDDPEYNLMNCNVKNIILIRNYKEAIVSQMLNTMVDAFNKYDYIQTPRAVINAPYELVEVPGHGLFFETYPDNPDANLDGFHHRGFLSPEKVEKLFKNLENATIQQKMKAFEYLFLRSKDHGVNPYFSKEKGLSYVNRLTYEARRYYGLLMLNELVLTRYPDRALTIRYEEFILDPFPSLNKTIDYLGENFKEPLILSVEEMKDNLNDLMENFEYHKNSSLQRYKEKYLGSSSTKKAVDTSYYSSHLSKEILLMFDNMLQNVHNVYSPTITREESRVIISAPSFPIAQKHLLYYKEKTNDNQKGD
tara:strand:+ start:595 stop:1698 length:1104 start_codon:yes stop_codon:yes gene_type:complete